MTKKYYRNCPKCNEKVFHKRKKDVNYFTKKKFLCRKCHLQERKELGNYNSKEEFICFTCKKTFKKWKGQMANPDTPFCSKQCWYNSELKSLVGEKIGRLLVIERIRENNKTSYICKCDCGKQIKTSHSTLKSKGDKSCGCLQIENLIKRSSKTPGYAVITNIFNYYKHNAKIANNLFELDRETFEKLINLPCHYCGQEKITTTKGKNGEVSHNGIDRVNSALGYNLTSSPFP